MSLFRKSDDSHERTPEEREYARQVREARRKGLPDPPRPGALDAEAEAEPAGAPVAEPHGHEPEPVYDVEPEPAYEPEPEDDAEPEPAYEPEPIAREPEPEPEPETAVHRIDDQDAVAPDAELPEHAEPAPEPEAAEAEPLAPPPAPLAADPDEDPLPDEDDDDLAEWTEPRRARRDEPPAPDPADALPPTEAYDVQDAPADFWDEPPPPVQPTGSHAAPPGDDLPPPRRDLGGVERQPPPLPARRSRREPPKAPRRRYTGAAARRSPAGPPTRRPRRWVGRVLALVALLGMIFVLWFVFSLFQPGKGEGDGRVAVVVPQGATAREIGDLLADKGVVSSGFFFDLRARIGGDRGNLKAGRFVLAEDMSYGAALERLSTSPEAPPTIGVTLPEGLSRKETAPLIKQAGVKGSYLKASVRHQGFNARSYGAPRNVASLEGFLFPATYELRKSQATARELVGQQLDAFETTFGEIDMRTARRKNLTPYDVVIIASMIEREAQLDKERRLISAVIYNRLRDGINLGIDATTRYELDNWTRPLRVSEIENPTPYNTRQNPGLPPGPIGNPGRASLEAAANPARADYLYYVVKPGTCGEHSFSATDAEFQQDVAEYEAARAANGGNSPDTCGD